MDNRAYFRQPNQTDILRILQDKEGKDRFLIRRFNPGSTIEFIQGNIVSVDLTEIEKIVNNGTYPLPQQVNEVDYIGLVKLCIEKIQAGQFEKLVPARQKLVKSDISPFELFQLLLNNFPEAFVYLLHFNGQWMIGASPETLMVKDDNILITEALGGTLTHGVYTEKESLEHSHIIKYISSKLKEHNYEYALMETKSRKAGPVEHLSTGFKLHSNGLNKDLALAEAMHPTPAVCGLPYKEAFEFLNKHEGMDRAYYSGYLGPVYANGNFELFVNLRCAEIFAGYYRLYAGAGVNALSRPEDEFQETENKMHTIAQWLK